ncbi:zinc finger, CCHC-type containing protein [Tanacetum coccineum]
MYICGWKPGVSVVCTRLDITSADVGMLDKFDRGLKTDVQVFVDFDYVMAEVAYMTLTGAWKKEIWLKGLLAESGYKLSLLAGIAIGALVKGGSWSEVPAQVEGVAYRLDSGFGCAEKAKLASIFELEVAVLLMSLKAGNLSLNMVCAYHVILLDLWWNPTTEDQTID